MPMKNPEDVFPNGNLLLRVERESMSYAEKIFDHNLIDKHVQEGFLCLSSLEYDLSCVKVTDLKGFLSAHDLKISGKKADLITRIIENVSTNDIRTLVPDSYLLLTHQELFITVCMILIFWNVNTYWPLWIMQFLKAI